MSNTSVPQSDRDAQALPVPASARAVLTIDLDALRGNYRSLRDMSGAKECAAVVKADAYGLGLDAVAPALWAEGARTFFVATLAEATELRGLLPDAVIYVLDGLLPGCAADLSAIDARPVLGSLDEIGQWAAFCTSTGNRYAAAIHIDTGMNRLGLSPDDVPLLAQRGHHLNAFEISLVMSHLVSGEERGSSITTTQVDDFNRLRALLPAAPASLGNSAGTQLGGNYASDLTRPGVALYGAQIFTDRPNPMRPVVKLEARILKIRDVPAGGTIGYGATFCAAAPMRVATLAIGYADGFSRALSAGNENPALDAPGLPAYIGEHAAPLIGRVSMDYIGIDVTGVPAVDLQRGGFAELIGTHVTIEDIARRSGTIAYEVLTSLGSRAHRIYRDLNTQKDI